MSADLKARFDAFTRSQITSEGRSLEELKRSTDVLKGQESLRLRQFCANECMEPGRDLDEFGRLLLSGSLQDVKNDYAKRISKYSNSTGASSSSELTAEERVRDDYYSMRWGPTKVTLYNLLNLFTIIVPQNYKSYMDMARFFITEAKVPVDGQELSGTRALSHAFSTKPSFNLELAQILYDAGGDVNARNRYGGTVAHEFIQLYQFHDRQICDRALKALEWFFSHGGNIDIADSDGMTARRMVDRLSKVGGATMRPIVLAVKNEDERRRKLGSKACKCCARTKQDGLLAHCGRCKKVSYCYGPKKSCQKLDWPRHKAECKAGAQ
ncbi:hypothetical protein CYLTODRAFT_372073 [Cylindrobasidium torrendii FP15055 ss-10]|uniref:MYND-type domain-containing protein n=1 Tax=Cylindrobasidium torrendii FP15055 ss-10 TaxID=1314674 RepID=A0A0D7BH92_9AGAR|nr:hypothetical protein CYLTODRAFT_372073 [Cylindrobasidium torrendii FP15055 ss-10]